INFSRIQHLSLNIPKNLFKIPLTFGIFTFLFRIVNPMNHSSHNKLVSFIWSIADDCLRDIYVCGKYRDIILPFVVLRRIDALLEPTKAEVLEEMRFQKEDLGQVELAPKGLESASGYVFYNTSTWTMDRLRSTTTNSQQKLVANFEEYLN